MISGESSKAEGGLQEGVEGSKDGNGSGDVERQEREGSDDSGSVSSQGQDSCMVRVSTTINDGLSRAFFWLGHKVGLYPWLTILLSLIVTFGLASFLFCCFVQETESDKLFVPQGTQSLIDKEDYTTYWGSEARFISILVTTNSDPIGNVIAKEDLLAAIDMWNDIETMQVSADGVEDFTLDDIRMNLPAFAGYTSILQAWGNNRTVLENDPDYLATMQAVPNLKDLVGGLVLSASGKPESGKALRITFFLKSNETDSVDVQGEAWEKALVELTQESGSESWKSEIIAYPQSAYSFTEEVGGAIGGDVGIVSASYFIIILYVMFVIQDKCDRVESSIALSLLGIGTIGLGILTAFGLSQALGIKYGNTHSVLPFIVLGVGADGCFILVNAFRRTTFKQSLPDRAGNALSHAGVSLAVSSLTNVAAFGIGSLTVIPDLSSFCKYASLSLFFLWVYLCTFYMAVLVLNERRVMKGRLDCLCCFSDCRKDYTYEPKEYTPGRLSHWMRSKYTPFITHNLFRIPVAFLAIAFVAVCGYLASTLTVESTGSNFLPDGSYLKTNFELQATYFGGAPTRVYVVSKKFDFNKRGEVYGMADKYRFPDTYETEPPYIDPNFSYWMEVFVSDLRANRTGNVQPGALVQDSQIGGLFPANEALFYQYLSFWLATSGSRFRSDVIFSDETQTKIERFRISMQHIPIGSFDDEGVFQEDAKEIVKAMDKMYEISDSFSFPVYPYAFEYTDEWSSFKVIGEELTQNVILALVCVLVVVSLLIGHPVTSSLVFLACSFTIIELLGTNAMLGLSVDTVVTVCVVLAVGISVDYSAHIGYAFMLENGTRKDRLGKVLEDVGVPVFNGAISTFLAVVLQSLSSSYVFRVVFYEFFFAILYSALNGLIFLPIVLSFVGPAPYKKTHATEKRKAFQ